MTPFILPAPNQFWGRRYGSYLTIKPKNLPNPWGNVFNVKRGSTRISDNKLPAGHRTRWYVGRAWRRALGKGWKKKSFVKKKSGRI